MGGKLWTPEEDQRLREAYARSTKVSDHLLTFPARSPDAIRSRAIAIGIEMVDWRGWTKAEMQSIKQVIASGKTLKACMHMFPGRTVLAVKQKIKYMGLEKPRGHSSWVWDAILRELAKNPDATGRALEKAIGCCYRQIMDRLYEHNRSGTKEVYISGWIRSNPDNSYPGPWIACWTLGNEPDAIRPTPQTAEDRRARDRARWRRRPGVKRRNPFAVAAGLVQAPQSNLVGRVFVQSMDVEEWPQARKAA